MAISDEELVRRLESVPMVEGPDFREPLMARVGTGFSRSSGRLKPARTLALGLAWAAAVAIVLGIVFLKTPEPNPRNARATMSAPAPSLDVVRDGDRFVVQPTVPGDIQFDPSKLVKVRQMPDGTVVLQRRPGATGPAEVRLVVSGKVVATNLLAR